MSEDKKYNGWTNYETWLVNLWMDNEEGSCSYWAEQSQEAYDNAAAGDSYSSQTRMESATCSLAEMLKEQHEEAIEQAGIKNGFIADLIGAAMSEVNWYEIAGHLLDEVEQEEEVQEA